MNIYGKEFREFCLAHSIDSFKLHDDVYITTGGFKYIQKIVNVHDGSNGGLVLGKSHSEGGIHLLQKNFDSIYRYAGEMEGGEYLSPANLNTNIFVELQEINKRKSNDIEIIPQDMNVIDLSKDKIQIILLAESTQFIVNKISTMSHLSKIMQIVGK